MENLEVQLDDVQDLDVGGDTFRGITGIDITTNLGRLEPVRFEGEMIGSGVERSADSQRFPYEVTIHSNSAMTLLELAKVATKADCTFTARERGAAAATRRTLQLTDLLIGGGRGSVSVQHREGGHSIQAVATDFEDVTAA